MARKSSIRLALLLLLVAIVLFSLYYGTSEGFQSKSYTINAKLSNTGTVTVINPPKELGQVVGGLKRITINQLNSSLGSLSNFSVQYLTGGRFVSPPPRVVDNGDTTLRIEGSKGKLRLPTARLTSTDKTLRLPQPVSMINPMLSILNIEQANLQGIAFDAAENIKLTLSFM